MTASLHVTRRVVNRTLAGPAFRAVTKSKETFDRIGNIEVRFVAFHRSNPCHIPRFFDPSGRFIECTTRESAKGEGEITSSLRGEGTRIKEWDEARKHERN
jgi:hypothetical protein